MAERLSSRETPGANVTQATYLEFLGKYDDADNKVAEAVAERKDLRAKIKSAGIPLVAFDRSRAEAKKSGEVREAEDMWFRRLMAWQAKPVGFQASMDLQTQDTGLAALNVHELKQIDAEGLQAGQRARRRDSNPYTPGTEAAQRWDNAWLRGQGDNVATLAKNPEAADAARAAAGKGAKKAANGANGSNGTGRPRGRPRGSKNQQKPDAAAQPAAGEQEPSQQVH